MSATSNISQTTAFKEWACIVEALAAGEQILILRKGGIHEKRKKFDVEHNSFFLFPTFEHQKPEDLTERGLAWLEKVKTHAKTAASQIPIHYFAEVKESVWVSDWDTLLRLAPFHVWSEQAVRKRFDWDDKPGLFVMVTRIYRLPQKETFANLPAYGGCRSWVQLDRTLSLAGMQPVLSQQLFDQKLQAIETFLS